jgi:hypothetical protein
MRPVRLMAATVTLGTLGVTATLASTPALASDHNPRVRVCAERLKVDLKPNQHWEGTLASGESFRVRKHSASGKYAYGLAYGHINRLGWVRTSGLCNPSDGSASSDSLAGRRVSVSDDLYVRNEPDQGWSGTLEPPETFQVEKLSASGKYAYGFAYGDINRRGWVLTSGLAGRQ